MKKIATHISAFFITMFVLGIIGLILYGLVVFVERLTIRGLIFVILIGIFIMLRMFIYKVLKHIE